MAGSGESRPSEGRPREPRALAAVPHAHFFASHLFSAPVSADSLEEIVGLDISYHGGIHQGDTETNASSFQEEERLYLERREERSRKQRNKLRRRILMMDLSLSTGRNAVVHSGNGGDDGSQGRDSGASNDPGECTPDRSEGSRLTADVEGAEEWREDVAPGHDHSS